MMLRLRHAAGAVIIPQESSPCQDLVHRYNIGVYTDAQTLWRAHNTHMNQAHTPRSEAFANEALAATIAARAVVLGKHFATPAPKRERKPVKVSFFSRFFKG